MRVSSLLAMGVVLYTACTHTQTHTHAMFVRGRKKDDPNDLSASSDPSPPADPATPPFDHTDNTPPSQPSEPQHEGAGPAVDGAIHEPELIPDDTTAHSVDQITYHDGTPKPPPLLTTTSEPTTTQIPDDRQCCFFLDETDLSHPALCSFGGSSDWVGELNDRLKAVRVGGKCNAVVFADPGYSGLVDVFGEGVHFLQRTGGDAMSAFKCDCNLQPEVIVNDPSSNHPDGPVSVTLPVDGSSIRCFTDAIPGRVYRFENGIRRWYPKPAVAASWDEHWETAVNIDCSGIKEGAELDYKPQPVEGQAFRCQEDVDAAKVYRYTNGVRRWYINPDVASSWDDMWQFCPTIDCTHIPEGEAIVEILPHTNQDGPKNEERFESRDGIVPLEHEDGSTGSTGDGKAVDFKDDIETHVKRIRPHYDARARISTSVEQLESSVGSQTVINMQVAQTVGALKEQLLILEGARTHTHTHEWHADPTHEDGHAKVDYK